jgi:hypothetical protein
MKFYQTSIALTIIFTLIACSTAKKKPAVASVPQSDSSRSLVLMPPLRPNGIYAPGNDELAAIQLQFHDATLGQLNEGYSIYTEGACIKCHHANNIYNYTEVKWKALIDEMAPLAQLSGVEKDAVYKYVLSIKATQSTQTAPK